MGLPTIIGAVIAGVTAASGVAAFFTISTTAAFFLTAGATALALNYLQNQIPEIGGSTSPTGNDFRISRPSATTPARYVYGRARVGGFPVFLDEVNYEDTEFVGKRAWHFQAFLISEGPAPIGFVEEIWLNGTQMPFNPINHGTSNSNWRLDAPIQTWETRLSTIRGQLTDPDNPPRGVDILLSFVENKLDDLKKRRGRRLPFTRSGVEYPDVDYHDRGIGWEATPPGSGELRASNVEGSDHRGEANETAFLSLRVWSGRDVGIDWTEEHAIKGISAVLIRLREAAGTTDPPFLNSPPRMEFLVRGRKISWPGQANPLWTENAAAIYYDYLVSVLGIDPDTIDTASFTAAYNLCNETITIAEVQRGDDAEDKDYHATDILEAMYGDDQSTWPSTTIQDLTLTIWNELYAGSANATIRYSINGVVDTSMDPREVERQFNAAWNGYCIERGGKIYFEPGKTKAISRTITEEDIVAGTNPSWQIEPPLQEKTTSVTCDLTQSRDHNWIAHSVPKVALDGEDDDYPRDLGRWAYVAYPSTASRLLDSAVKRANGGKKVSLTITRGANWDHYRISPTDRIALRLPSEGHDSATDKFFVEKMETTMEGTVNLTLTQEHPEAYNNRPKVPLELGARGK